MIRLYSEWRRWETGNPLCVDASYCIINVLYFGVFPCSLCSMHFSAQIYTKFTSCVSMQVTVLCFRIVPRSTLKWLFHTHLLSSAALLHCFIYNSTPLLSYYPHALPAITMTAITSSLVGLTTVSLSPVPLPIIAALGRIRDCSTVLTVSPIRETQSNKQDQRERLAFTLWGVDDHTFNRFGELAFIARNIVLVIFS